MEDKSKESRALANKFNNDDKYYNFIANRYYYSCFQKLLYLAKSKFSFSSNENSGSSHIELIMFIDTEVNKAMKDSNKRMKLMKARNIKANFMTLKKYRVKADYENEDITKEEINIINEKIKDFDRSFQIIKDET